MGGKGSILVVDEDPESLSLVVDLLAAEGFDVHAADNACLALDALTAHCADLMLITPRVADSDLFALCGRVKACAKCADLPVVFITRSGDTDAHVRAFGAGAADFVDKPFRPEELLGRVRVQLEIRRLRSELERQAAQTAADLHDAAGRLTAEITRHRRTEGVLRVRDDSFRAMFEQATVGIVQSRSDGRITAANDRFCRMVGYGAAELLKMSYRDFTHPDDLGYDDSQIGRVLDGEIRSYRTEKRFVRKDGTCIWVGVYGSLLAVSEEQKRLFSIIEDITDRKQAEEDLRRQLAFDDLVTQMLTEFARCSADSADTAIVSGLMDLCEFIRADYGYVVQFDEGGEHWSVTHEWCAEGCPRYMSVLQHMPVVAVGWCAQQIFHGRVVEIDSLEDFPPEAEPDRDFHASRGVTALLTVPIIDARGNVLGCIGVHKRSLNPGWRAGDRSRLETISSAVAGLLQRKRSERAVRESEERFRSLADTAPVMIWLLDPEQAVTFCNKHALAFVGLPLSAFERSVSQLLYPADWAREGPRVRESLQSRRAFAVEMRVKRADGQFRWVLLSGVPRLVDGVYLGYVGTGVDISDVKAAYDQHLAAQKLESLGVLAAGVAHEFNNLLGSILVRVDSIASQLSSASTAIHDAEQIRTVVKRAASVVNQLLTFAGHEGTRLSAVWLAPLIRDMNEFLRVSIAKSVTLNVTVDEDLPSVLADPAELGQIIMNLVTNASEALGGKAGTITVAARLGTSKLAGLSPGQYVELEVQDTGCGMTDEVKSRIYDPFFTTKFAGRGLGLSAVQGAVRRYGGIIYVESAPGAGSRFTVALPCTLERPCLTEEVRDTGGTEVLPVNPTVLLVEDEETLRVTVSKLLRRNGFVVLDTPDGATAIELFRTHQSSIAVAFVDLTLPNMSGADVVSQLRALDPGIRIVLTTGYTRQMADSQVGADTITGFIRKPYTITDLLRTLREALSK